eukprot:bmy_18442T0
MEEKGQTCVGSDASVCSPSQGSTLRSHIGMGRCFTLHTTLGVEAEKPVTVSKPHRMVGEVTSEGRCFVPRAEGAPGVEVSLEKVPPSPMLICMVIFFLESVAAMLQIGFTVIVLSRSGTLDDAGCCSQAT